MLKVYKDLFPNNEIYIGQTTKTLKERWRYGCGYYGNDKMMDLIRYYKSIYPGFVPEMELLQYNLSEDEADYWEAYYVNYYNRAPYTVLNMESGGHKGKTLATSTKKKLSESRQIYYQSHQEKLTPVIQLSYTGEVLGRYKSPQEAAFYTGLNPASIYSCATGRKNSLKGTVWRVDDGKKYPIMYLPKKRVTVQIDPNTNQVVGVYESRSEAERQTGISHKNICSCIKGKRNMAGGYIWAELFD